MARIAAVSPALPTHVYSQAEITDTIAPMVTSDPARQAVMRRLHGGSGVQTRHLVMPIERYRDSSTFTQSNGMFIEVAADLTEQALRDALRTANLEPRDIDYVMFTSVTGISAPSIDALLVARLGLRPDVKRVPMYGLGCVAGAAGIARVNDYLVGHPNDVAVLLAVELCSLTFQRDDDSTANLVATGLFGDGAAAVVMVGDQRAKRMPVTGPDVIDARSQLYPDTHEVIGFNASETGFRIILTAQVSEVIERNFGADVTAFLASNGLEVSDIDTWVAHPGGPRVLESFQSSLGLPDGVFDNSWSSLARVGNLSSASVLHVLAEELETPQNAGEETLLFALGPGVSAELVLLRWPR
ncbi:MAG: type polyketide synthase [Microbacteriaceae bacterium]|jgi:alkylresorcinol/alkylpyrone synthase|nr:type polyketide synthase [Microbacteriaceae bacterium]